MRMLLIPSLEKPDEEDSSLLLLKCLSEVAIRRGWGIYLAVPPETPVEGWNKEVHICRVQYDSWSRHIAALSAAGPVGRLVNTGPGSLPIDCIVTTDQMAAYMIYMYLQDEFAHHAPQVFTASASSTYIGADEMAGKGDQQSRIAAHILGAAVACNFQPTDFMKQMILESGRVYLGPSMFNMLEKNTKVSLIGPWCSVLDEVRKDKRPTMSLYYGGRFTTTKMGQNAVKQYIRLVEGGREADILVSAMGAYSRLSALLKKEGAERMVQVFSKMSASEAWSLMSSCHVSMFYQSLKILPSSPYEQLYCGLVTLIQDHGYEKVLLPPDYPWLFKTENEAAAMLRHVYDNYDEVVKETAQYSKWVGDNLDREVAYSKALDLIESRLSESKHAFLTDYGNAKVTFDQMNLVLNGLGDGATWELVLQGLKKQGVSFHPKEHASNFGHGISPIMIYRNFIPEGWQDAGGRMPIFTRRKDDNTD